MRPVTFFVLCAAAGAAWPAAALDAAQERQERLRIQTERKQAEASHAQRERECRARFVVTTCLDEASRDRRRTLQSLRQQQQVLDEWQRKQRAAERMDAIRAKVGDEEAKDQAAAARAGRPDKPHPEAKAPVAPKAVSPEAAAAAAAQRQAQSAAEAARHRADFEHQRDEAMAHKAAVERRNAERAAQGKAPAASLPVPHAPSAPASARR
jgi:colicin import membrane protein